MSLVACGTTACLQMSIYLSILTALCRCVLHFMPVSSCVALLVVSGTPPGLKPAIRSTAGPPYSKTTILIFWLCCRRCIPSPVVFWRCGCPLGVMVVEAILLSVVVLPINFEFLEEDCRLTCSLRAYAKKKIYMHGVLVLR